MCLIVRYSQPAQLQLTAKQLFILTSAFKPNGIKIHQSKITNTTKLRAMLSQPSSLKQSVLQIMRQSMINTNYSWLYCMFPFRYDCNTINEKNIQQLAFYQQWSQPQAIVNQENSLCCKDTVSILLDQMVFGTLNKAAMIQFWQHCSQNAMCMRPVAPDSFGCKRSSFSFSKATVSRSSQSPTALYIQGNTPWVNFN